MVGAMPAIGHGQYTRKPEPTRRRPGHTFDGQLPSLYTSHHPPGSSRTRCDGRAPGSSLDGSAADRSSFLSWHRGLREFHGHRRHPRQSRPTRGGGNPNAESTHLLLRLAERTIALSGADCPGHQLAASGSIRHAAAGHGSVWICLLGADAERLFPKTYFCEYCRMIFRRILELIHDAPSVVFVEILEQSLPMRRGTRSRISPLVAHIRLFYLYTQVWFLQMNHFSMHGMAGIHGVDAPFWWRQWTAFTWRRRGRMHNASQNHTESHPFFDTRRDRVLLSTSSPGKREPSFVAPFAAHFV
jgi:hypothetical protein